jgi:hypothetical protein
LNEGTYTDGDTRLTVYHGASARDRISDYLPLGFSVGIDLFAYTQDEFDQLPRTSPGWYKAIMSGVEI